MLNQNMWRASVQGGEERGIGDGGVDGGGGREEEGRRRERERESEERDGRERERSCTVMPCCILLNCIIEKIQRQHMAPRGRQTSKQESTDRFENSTEDKSTSFKTITRGKRRQRKHNSVEKRKRKRKRQDRTKRDRYEAMERGERKEQRNMMLDRARHAYVFLHGYLTWNDGMPWFHSSEPNWADKKLMQGTAAAIKSLPMDCRRVQKWKLGHQTQREERTVVFDVLLIDLASRARRYSQTLACF